MLAEVEASPVLRDRWTYFQAYYSCKLNKANIYEMWEFPGTDYIELVEVNPASLGEEFLKTVCPK